MTYKNTIKFLFFELISDPCRADFSRTQSYGALPNTYIPRILFLLLSILHVKIPYFWSTQFHVYRIYKIQTK